jgi:hypothetical protein
VANPQSNWFVRSRLKTRQIVLLLQLYDQRPVLRAAELAGMTQPAASKDQFWPLLGRNYDGADPANADLYHPKHDEPYHDTDSWYTQDPKYHQIWFNCIRDLLDSCEPDLLYSDGGLPFGVVGRPR